MKYFWIAIFLLTGYFVINAYVKSIYLDMRKSYKSKEKSDRLVAKRNEGK